MTVYRYNIDQSDIKYVIATKSASNISYVIPPK
jgi:hypothetical protein